MIQSEEVMPTKSMNCGSTCVTIQLESYGTQYHFCFQRFLFLASKQTIAIAWKKPAISIQEVKARMTLMLINEKMTSVLNDSQAKISQGVEPLAPLRLAF